MQNDPYGDSPMDVQSDTTNPVLANQIQLLYQENLGRSASPQEIQDWIKGSNGGNYTIIRNGILGSEEAKAYALKKKPVVPTPDPGPDPGTGGGGGGGYGVFGDLTKPWGGTFTPPTPSALPSAPGFTPVPFKQAPAFQAPTLADAQNEPGFAFQLSEGSKALEHSAAAKGILNTGGTLKDIARWSQGLADTTYGNVYNRALNSYQTNYQTQFADPWRIQEQSALDAFNPQFSAWQTNAASTQRANELGYNNAWDRYSFDYNAWRSRNLDTANLILPIATA